MIAFDKKKTERNFQAAGFPGVTLCALNVFVSGDSRPWSDTTSLISSHNILNPVGVSFTSQHRKFTDFALLSQELKNYFLFNFGML